MARTRAAEVRSYARAVERAERRAEQARAERDEAIRAAYREGMSVQELMRVTGMSRPRIYQIVRG